MFNWTINNLPKILYKKVSFFLEHESWLFEKVPLLSISAEFEQRHFLLFPKKFIIICFETQ